uniref:Ankyrin repeat domain 63 n=1 Tax=Hucho hucho TaxID=62062 RepID=A0A4W5PYT1_9TELE
MAHIKNAAMFFSLSNYSVQITENGRTPLMFAVCLQDPGGRAKFTRLLLEKGADVNCQDEHGRTSLSLACELGHLDMVKLLVQFNADPDVSDAWGNSALMYAAYTGHSHVLEFLNTKTMCNVFSAGGRSSALHAKHVCFIYSNQCKYFTHTHVQ